MLNKSLNASLRFREQSQCNDFNFLMQSMERDKDRDKDK